MASSNAHHVLRRPQAEALFFKPPPRENIETNFSLDGADVSSDYLGLKRGQTRKEGLKRRD